MDKDKPVKQVARARAANGTFLPGSSANSKGRPPRAHCLSDAIYELLSNDPEEVIAKWKKGKMTGARYAAVAWYKKVHAGDLTALNIGLERTEGKVAQPVTGEGGGPLTFNLVVQSDKDKAALEEAKKRLT